MFVALLPNLHNLTLLTFSFHLKKNGYLINFVANYTHHMKLLSTLRQIARYQQKLISILDKNTCIYCDNLKLFSNTASPNQWGKNKNHRNVKLQWYFDTMADAKIEEILAPLRSKVKEQVSSTWIISLKTIFLHYFTLG